MLAVGPEARDHPVDRRRPCDMHVHGVGTRGPGAEVRCGHGPRSGLRCRRRRVRPGVRRAAEAAVHAAVNLGFSTTLLTVRLEGEAREIGKVAASLAKDAMDGSCLVLGGETTVTVRGNGKGGRNQELALAAAVSLDGWERTAIISFATDGEDGPTDAAGAIATGETIARARNLSINPLLYLDRNDAYHFFEEVGGHIRTGSTGTNVNDLVFILKYAQYLD